MKSPFTGGTVTLHTHKTEITFRKEHFTVIAQFYTCNDTGEEFTTTEQDELTINQVYNQYREKYGIPFIDEINDILERYNMSASKMSKILGFGDNQYLKYTKGEMPSISNGRMIAQIKDVSEFKRLLHIAKNEFSADELSKIEKRITPLQSVSTSLLEQLLADSTKLFNEKSIYTGYVKPNINRIKNIILYFVTKNEGVFETKLNKLLFYSDFLCFKETGSGLTGLSYKAIAFGPVPQQYATIYENIKGTESEIIIFPNGNAGKRIIGHEKFNPELFSVKELEILERVFNRFKDCTACNISNISHEEDAWIENHQTQRIIRYDYGFTLKAF
ncbi:MAG: type II toxin-antitoxin system antitoxin SocA domain-containing protein [Tannerellaceae bacterium]